jgi:hypothetical protein
VDIDKGEKAMEPKTYNLYLTLMAKIATFAPPAILALVGFLFLSGAFQSAKGEPPQFIGVFFLIVPAGIWYFILSIPHKIKVYETGEIEFVSVLRKKRVMPLEIQSIKPQGSQFGFLMVRTNHGKIKLANQFDGFHEFITNLKVANPSIEIRGC